MEINCTLTITTTAANGVVFNGVATEEKKSVIHSLRMTVCHAETAGNERKYNDVHGKRRKGRSVPSKCVLAGNRVRFQHFLLRGA